MTRFQYTFVCLHPACPKQTTGCIWTTATDREKHVHAVTDSRPYACDGCEMQFSNSGPLLNHKNVHDKKRKRIDCPYDECTSTFLSATGLPDHGNGPRHENIRHMCPTCGLSYAHFQDLISHPHIMDPDH